MKHRTYSGTSLLEMLVVIAVLSILAAFAKPSFHWLIRRTYRQQAEILLTQAMIDLQDFYFQHHTYQHAALHIIKKIPYEFFLEQKSRDYIIIRAIPSGDQFSDRCGALSIDENNIITSNESNCEP